MKLAKNKNFPAALRKARMGANLSVQQLARMTGVSAQAIYQYENGLRSPRANRLQALEAVLLEGSKGVEQTAKKPASKKAASTNPLHKATVEELTSELSRRGFQVVLGK